MASPECRVVSVNSKVDFFLKEGRIVRREETI